MNIYEYYSQPVNDIFWWDGASVLLVFGITATLGTFFCWLLRKMLRVPNMTREDQWVYEAHMWAGFSDHRLVVFLLIGIVVSRLCLPISPFLDEIYRMLATCLGMLFAACMAVAWQLETWSSNYLCWYSPPLGKLTMAFLMTSPINRVWRFITAFIGLRSMPDIIIVGQPKAGTKALVKGLATLPYLRFCSPGYDFVPAEGCYFHGLVGDFAFRFPSCYSMIFPTKISRFFTKLWYGTVAYIDSHTLNFKTLHLVKNYLRPETKLIMCVRDPVKAYISYAKMMIRIATVFKAQGKTVDKRRYPDPEKDTFDFKDNVDFGIDNFEKFKEWRTMEFKNGWNPDTWVIEWKSAIYWYCYHTHIEDLEKHFGKGRIKIVIQEDLCKQPRATLIKLFHDLKMNIGENEIDRMVVELESEAVASKTSQGAGTTISIDRAAEDRLRKFYSPYNSLLSHRYNEPKFDGWSKQKLKA